MHGSSNILWQRATHFIVGWLAGHIGTTNRVNYCVIFFTTHAAYKCGRGLHNTWRTSCGPRAVVWRSVIENVVNNKAVGEEKLPYPSTDIIQEKDSLIASEVI